MEDEQQALPVQVRHLETTHSEEIKTYEVVYTEANLQATQAAPVAQTTASLQWIYMEWPQGMEEED